MFQSKKWSSFWKYILEIKEKIIYIKLILIFTNVRINIIWVKSAICSKIMSIVIIVSNIFLKIK